jgi:ParB family chromosome partitioning protein
MTSEQQRPAPEGVRLQKEAFARGHQFSAHPFNSIKENVMTATANAKKLKNAPKTPAVVAMNAGVLGTARPQGRDMLVPLNQLFVSKHNARKKRNNNSLPELKALILAMGLMQRLTIVEEDGRYGVVAGGRRYEAMMLAVSTGEMAADALIECKLYDSVHSAKLSLAENSGREEMHPADQIASFKRLIDEDGMSVAEVATAYGVTPMTVERRLKLANLSPRFIDMYREGQIEGDILAVLTLGDDHQTQEAAWDSLSHYDRSAYHLREVLLNGELKATSRLARFVGVEAYEAAGGKTRLDLFAEDGNGIYLLDTDLLHSLAKAKLQDVADKLSAQGWSWVECSLESNSSDYRNFGRERKGSRVLSELEQAEHDRLQAEADATSKAFDKHREDGDEDAPDYDSLYEELETASDQASAALETFEQGVAMWTDEQKARAGALVNLSYSGAIETSVGLVRPSDKKAAVEAMEAAGQTVPQDMKRGMRAEFSDRLVRDMTAHRTAALQAAMSQNPKVALVATVHAMAMSAFGSYNSGRRALKISIEETDDAALAQLATDYHESKAAAVLLEAQQMWGDQLPGESAPLFAWLSNQPQVLLLDALAFFAARSINVVTGAPREQRDESDVLAEALGVDMADWWTPSPSNFFSAVSKAKAAECIAEATGFDATKELASKKKDAANTYSTAKVTGTRWLPRPLRAIGAAVGKEPATA